MNYTRLGATGLNVAKLCLGRMTYGVPERGSRHCTLEEEQSRPFLGRAFDRCITLLDTSNTSSNATGEEIVGRALGKFARRDEIVVATKGFLPRPKKPNIGANLVLEQPKRAALSDGLFKRNSPRGTPGFLRSQQHHDQTIPPRLHFLRFPLGFRATVPSGEQIEVCARKNNVSRGI